MDIAHIRQEYARATLDEKDAVSDPLALFSRWFDEALKSRVPVPNAMTLATIAPEGGADARIVLLKGFDARGFLFFTNYLSRKGRELAADPKASLVFFWAELERQVRVEGTVEKIDAPESDEYFATRPLGSRLGAWASPQSEVLPGRADLEASLAAVTRQYGDNPPRPPHWGGYVLRPAAIEFWQGRASRLHDRLRYRAVGGNAWALERLAP